MADPRVFGNADSAASTPGGAGPINAKLRLMTTQLDQMLVRAFISDASSAAIASGSATTVLASGTTRTFVEIQNVGPSSIWFNFNTDAVAAQPSFLLTTGLTWRSPVVFCPQGRLSVISIANTAPVTVKYG